MSAKQTFALCIDCWEFHYGIPNSNGVYSRDSGSSNHWDHAVHVFGAPDEYTSSLETPIRAVLMDLQREVPISSGRMEMFSLACALSAIQPNNGRQAAGTDVPLGAVELVSEKRRKQRKEHR
ncbi:hypothetical protein GCM10009785_13750 [Brooklawnia cerclae]|uniref:Uncharacterized protein n=1 Tax=Brooklawnia cerclae TaxID=349934 RepID=A0ABX0SNZ6_9ACTN|nr:hypothetical protein [Brooklawnia cerclae]NIH58511.1 hypothetical protein [Brooklawnia cerclae]